MESGFTFNVKYFTAGQNCQLKYKSNSLYKFPITKISGIVRL
ncbi:MAG: hypothetical protein KatS3mg037_0124 [Ignavibacterium sp.]|nr:MAG: hypothetical protein KatS3mg037_0124 [Ignavibacterium sp.]